MQPLDKTLRNRLERTIKDARDIAEDAARAALEQLAVGETAPFAHLSEQERELRRKLRVHGRQLGDSLNGSKIQTMDRLIEEVAYEHWHRMLFARFLAENNLLMYPDPDDPVAVTLEECEDLAADEGAANGWELAARFAARMLPQIFRLDSPVFQLSLPPEHQQKLERLVADLELPVFTASDSLGWVYQFWQADNKERINKSEVKIGSRELPAVTQLFTEPYMVSFLLDNSLGAWWAARRLSEADLKNASSEEELRRKAAIPGVPLDYLRFVVARAGSSGIPSEPQTHRCREKVARPSWSGLLSIPGLDETSLSITKGENLPHWTCDRAIYHVCFRLADSVPSAKRDAWFAERKAIEDQAILANRPLNEEEQKRIQFLYSERIEAFLDSGAGECCLVNPDIADMVANALRYFDGERYQLHAWCIMPNHVHVIVEPHQGWELSGIIHSWKSFTANEANKYLGRKGHLWQEDAYNHIIRSEKEYFFQIQYTWDNPDKAGLGDWKWRWKRPDQDGLATITPGSEEFAGLEVPDQDGPATFMPAAGTFDSWPEQLADLKILDPCCGSGHFLVAAFLMLVPMRMEREGLSARDAVDAVLRENIHGLELDQRCVELAAFALALTAWKYPNAGGYRVLPELHLACSGLSVTMSREEWRQLGARKQNIYLALGILHDLFARAPILGSLIDPHKTEASELVGPKNNFGFGWNDVCQVLEQAVGAEAPFEHHETAVVARGVAKAVTLLAQRYHWVITNVPYLARGKQTEGLRDFCERHYPAAKNDLATVFLERCLELCVEGGTSSIVLPQNWLFLTSYKKFREKLLKRDTWHLIARLGEGGFDSSAAAGAFVAMIILSRGAEGSQSFQLWSEGDRPHHDAAPNLIRGVDVSEPRTATEKAAQLRTAEIKSVEQAKQLENPDARVGFEKFQSLPLLAEIADYGKGSTTGDGPRFLMYFWEFPEGEKTHVYWLNSPNAGNPWTGRSQLCKVPLDDVELNTQLGCRLHGQSVFCRRGVVVNKMRKLEPFLYNGEAFDDNICPICPSTENVIPAIFAYVESDVFHENVRAVDQALKVTAATITKVPFDLDRWTKVAEEKYPNGLPKPYTNDPTQWIFHGHPCGSVVWNEETKRLESASTLRTDATVLQVAVARLLGYRWPAELDASMELAEEQREWVKRCESLSSYADDDGIVCIPPVRGEASASDRLLNLLAAAYKVARASSSGNSSESPDQDGLATVPLAALLKSADHAGKTLETWLREKFFTQHCKLFQHRPFIWHIWDGLPDGFAALVNYHKLDAKLLETLIYTYLGDWISRQKQDIASKVDGAQERLAAAESLKKKLELILEGQAPYDIFVRWKPLEKQPIGWDPDLNDGVRLNIRPFLSVPDVGKKGAGVLRDKPNINWNKDRGKDVESAPWYHVFDGDRINDHHLTLEVKGDARKLT
ncbi:MAG: N-6 DNA methylase [bacterium]|nr:N-6 DNA methylase [bacterium]